MRFIFLLFFFLTIVSCNEPSTSANKSSLAGKWLLWKIVDYNIQERKFDTLDLFDSAKSVKKIYASKVSYLDAGIPGIDTNDLRGLASFEYESLKKMSFELKEDHSFFTQTSSALLFSMPGYRNSENESVFRNWNQYKDTLEFATPDARLKRSEFYKVLNFKNDTLWITNIGRDSNVVRDRFAFIR